MREIRFRGWHTIQKKMYSAETMAQDQLTLLPTGQFINVSGQSTKLSTIFSQDKFIPLQFTGLKDKNDKEIYEGDILKCSEGKSLGNPIFRVVYEEFDTAFSAFDIKAKCWVKLNALHYEVIGNIYENPELLKESES